MGSAVEGKTLVTADVLSRWLGVSETIIRELARKGIVVRAGRGKYDLERSVCNVVSDMRRTISHKGDGESLESVRAEKIRLTRAQAQAQEIKNRALSGELVESAAVEREWSDILRGVRAEMLAVASACGQRLPHLSPHDVATIDEEIRHRLTRLGKGT